MELEEVDVPGFSTRRVLLPREWTTDVHSRYTPLTVDATSGVATTAAANRESHNTIRAERLDASGDTLYLTELYVAREGPTPVTPPDRVPSPLREEALLRAVTSGRAGRAPLQVWVKEVEASRSASSIAAQLLPTHHVILELVLDVEEGASARAVAMAEAILLDTVHKLTGAVHDLCGGNLHAGSSSPTATPSSAVPSMPSTRWWDSLRAQLTGEVGAAMRAGVYSEAGGGIFVLADAARGALQRACWGSCAASPSATTDPVTEDLRCFVTRALRLGVLEGLSLSIQSAHRALDTPGEWDEPPALPEALVVASFPLPPPGLFSLYNFLSLERAFEQHLTTALSREAEGPQPTWRMTRLGPSARFAPSLDFMRAVSAVQEEELAARLPGEGAPMPSAMPAVPSRSALYAFRQDAASVAYVAQLVAPRVSSRLAMVVMAAVRVTDAADDECLTAAGVRLQSLLTIEYPSTHLWSAAVSALPRGGFLFGQGFLVLGIPADDVRYAGCRVVPTACQAFSTLGSLTVHAAPSAHGRTTATPIPSSSGQSSTAMDEAKSSSAAPMADLSVVWTLVADGRSAQEYMDFTLAEYYYDSGVYSLSNVAQRITALKEHRNVVRAHEKRRWPNVWWPQPRPHCPPSAGAATAAWSCWVEVGPRLRVLLAVQERGIGRLLVAQCNLLTDGRPSATEHAGDGPALKDGEWSAAEELRARYVERWVFGISAGTVHR